MVDERGAGVTILHARAHTYMHTPAHAHPRLQFEIQVPQDDYNLLAWQLGKYISDPTQRAEEVKRSQLRVRVCVCACVLFLRVCVCVCGSTMGCLRLACCAVSFVSALV